MSGTNRINESIRDTGNKKQAYEVDEKFDDDFYDKLASTKQQKKMKPKSDDNDKQLQFYSTSKLIIARLWLSIIYRMF